MAAYKPAFRKQGDGSTCQWANCNCTSHAMAVDRWTRGAKIGSQTAIRHHINLYCPGTSFAQNRNATAYLYNISLEYHWGDPWSVFVAGIKAGRAGVVGMLYAPLHGTVFDASRNFDGRHAILVNDWRHNSNLNRDEFLVFDPLADKRYSWIPQGPQWWPSTLLYKTMTQYASGTLEWAFTKNTEWVNRTSCAGAKLRVSPDAGAALKATLTNSSTLYTAISSVSGGLWAATMCGKSKSGSGWYKVTAVNGKSTTSLYGVSALYMATGWVA